MNNDNILTQHREGRVLVLTLNRPDKRNAINTALLDAIEAAFAQPLDDVGAILLRGDGPCFCAGLDLTERLESPRKSAFDTVRHSRRWHRVFESIQFGPVPVVAALHGAVVGGGLELAAATHVRVSEASTFFQLPEGQHGIFVGGGASVRVPRIIGAGRMVEMMLTGRRVDANEGLRLGLSHYVVEQGDGYRTALELAKRIAGNAEISNFAIVQAIPRINDMATADGLFTESLVASLSRSTNAADERMARFRRSDDTVVNN
jgi:enoyl-CoA hydratase/carnithine racemase